MPLRRSFVLGSRHCPDLHEYDQLFPGGVILIPSVDDGRWSALYLPEIGCNSLVVRLLLFDGDSEHFRLVYPSTEDIPSTVRVWEINYPEDIDSEPEYTQLTFEDAELEEAWMYNQPRKASP